MEKRIIAEDLQKNSSGSNFGIYLEDTKIILEYVGSLDLDDAEDQKFINLEFEIDEFKSLIQQVIGKGKLMVAGNGLEIIKSASGELQFIDRGSYYGITIVTGWRPEEILRKIDALKK